MEKLGDCGLKEEYSLPEVCGRLSISVATGRNWVRMGKIKPTKIKSGKPYFSSTYVNEMLERLRTGKSLKTRRNKAYISGNSVYRNYLPQPSQNSGSVEALIGLLGQKILTEGQVRAILAECALQLLCQAYGIEPGVRENYLLHYSKGEIRLGQYGALVQELALDSGGFTTEQCQRVQGELPGAFCIPYFWEGNTDVLGMLYSSLKGIGNRKAEGSYYTPTHIVEKLICSLFPDPKVGGADGWKVMDPCCGTGNFLLRLPESFSIGQLAGRDIDRVSVLLARINMALKFKGAPVSLIKEQVKVQDFLLGEEGRGYHLILGNPPWGFRFGEEAERLLRAKFHTAQGKHVESYDVFLEQSLRCAADGGRVAFVLPEAVLDVKSHMEARRVILEQAQIEEVIYLGDVFDAVQCPSIILNMRKATEPMDTYGIKVSAQGKNFQILTSRNLTAGNFNFHMEDWEYRLVQKMANEGNTTYLKGQAEFALGIVTGNNKKILQGRKVEGSELVLKGADIRRYQINGSGTYLVYEPEKFQQSAPTGLYRAKEKLLYRFIGNQLVFAYDNRQRLSLNSCNILIPHVESLHIKYILAVLNSRAANFYYHKMFHSLKVLRSHLEQIPIPLAAEGRQQEIIAVVEKIMEEGNSGKWMEYYNRVDRLVSSAYELDETEHRAICDAEQEGGLKTKPI